MSSSAQQQRSLRARGIFMAVLVAGTFGVMLAHLFNLQVIRGLQFKSIARSVARRQLPILARRGEIYDRNYDVPLVTNGSTLAIDLIPGDVDRDEREALFGRLARELHIEIEDLKDGVPPSVYGSYQPVEIKGDVSFERIAYFAERIEEYPGITWHVKPLRSYEETGSIAHIIGYVGDLTREEYQLYYGKGYTLGSVIGKSGVERRYDEVLRGTDGRRTYMADVRGRILAGTAEEAVAPAPGRDVVLTVDAHLQRICEKALGERIGSVLVMKPATGEILAMVSYPYFDPNDFYTAQAREKLAKLSLDKSYPFLNRTIHSAYPPASVFKIIMTAAALVEEPFPATREVNCTGELFYGGELRHCWKTEGHGPLDLRGGLAQSCNVYFWTLGLELGVDTITRYAREFGLGSRAGIDLAGELPGFVPTPEWKKEEKHRGWWDGDTLNLSVGQGFLTVTPLQMADTIALVANQGTLYRPHVVKEIRDADTGAVVERIEPEVLHRADLPAETYATLQRNMRGVITDGTAEVVLTTKAVEVVGKTGTGESGNVDKADADSWHSWFAAYAPYETDDPEERVVVVTMVEAVNEWEWWAPKAANIIFQAIFADQDYEEAIRALGDPWLLQELRRGGADTRGSTP